MRPSPRQPPARRPSACGTATSGSGPKRSLPAALTVLARAWILVRASTVVLAWTVELSRAAGARAAPAPLDDKRRHHAQAEHQAGGQRHTYHLDAITEPARQCHWLGIGVLAS